MGDIIPGLKTDGAPTTKQISDGRRVLWQVVGVACDVYGFLVLQCTARRHVSVGFLYSVTSRVTWCDHPQRRLHLADDKRHICRTHAPCRTGTVQL